MFKIYVYVFPIVFPFREAQWWSSSMFGAGCYLLFMYHQTSLYLAVGWGTSKEKGCSSKSRKARPTSQQQPWQYMQFFVQQNNTKWVAKLAYLQYKTPAQCQEWCLVHRIACVCSFPSSNKYFIYTQRIGISLSYKLQRTAQAYQKQLRQHFILF